MAKALDQKLHRIEWKESWRGLRLKQIIAAEALGLSSRNAFLVIKNGLVRTADGGVLDDADLAMTEGVALVVDLRHGVHGKGTTTRAPLHHRMQVLHDDYHVVVVGKQSGTPVQPIEDDGLDDEEADRTKEAPLVELLKHYWKQQNKPIVNPYLVQRLDLETSGLLVLGKTDVAAAALQRQLKAPRTLKRRYLALVAGVFVLDKGEWQTSMGYGKSGLRQTLTPGGPEKGQDAITFFEVRERFANASLVAFELETGRTHQIRIHTAEAMHPVLGDRLYKRHGDHARTVMTDNPDRKIPANHPYLEARAALAREVPPPPDAPRTMLHSTELSFIHPDSGEVMTFRQDPPEDFATLLKALRG
jgi:23S rRNA pseudouridine1911/1915/1917 synthase